MYRPHNDNAGCLLAFLRLFSAEDRAKGPLPYRVRDDFLSQTETNFYRVLVSVVGDRLLVFPKVRLADILFVTGKNDYFAFFNRISARHLDFLLCYPQTLKPVLGIELDDASHSHDDRTKRDDFVDKAFAAAGLGLLRVRAQRSYDVQQLRTLLSPYFGTACPVASAQFRATDVTASPGPPLCPKCGIPMVLRTSKRSGTMARSFYGCANYPRCREIVDA
jgi:hypothetical protein